TGKWTVDSATETGTALTLIAEAVFSRCLSALKDERVAASSVLAGPTVTRLTDRDQFVSDVEMALYASKIISYAQGYALMLLQAQRDYFGAHTYERLDKPRGQFFHTNWTGRGGTTASTTYNV